MQRRLEAADNDDSLPTDDCNRAYAVAVMELSESHRVPKISIEIKTELFLMLIFLFFISLEVTILRESFL